MKKKPKAKPIVTSPPKMGRPSLYRHEYCQQLLDFVNKDPITNCIDAFAIHLDVDDDTIYEWRKVHPNFSVSMRKAQKIRRLAMESLGKAFITGKNRNGNAHVYQFFMRNWFKEHYVERVEMKQEIEAKIETGLSDELGEIIRAMQQIPATSKT